MISTIGRSKRRLLTIPILLYRPNRTFRAPPHVDHMMIRKWLADSDNIFAKHKWHSPFEAFCLPPATKVSVTSSSITLNNPFCEIAFVVGRSGGFAGDPKRRADQRLQESSHLWTWTTPIYVTTQYSSWRAQHKDKQKYQNWAENLVAGVKLWFGTVSDHLAGSFDADEEGSGHAPILRTTTPRN